MKRITLCNVTPYAGLLFALIVNTTRADVRLPALISDHMVLQASEPVQIWGWAKSNEAVSVMIGEQKLTTHADASGNWSVALSPLKAGIHLTLTVQGANTIVVQDVLVGEVWLGSGQSNMGSKVISAKNFTTEKSAADYPEIRIFTVSLNASSKPLDDCRGTWQVCNSNTVENFSAMLYFFGRDLHQQLKVPVGLIHSSWGGTPIQPWISLDILKAYPGYAAMLERKKEEMAAWPERERKILGDLKAWEQADVAAKAAHQPEPPKPWNPGPPDSGQYMPGQLYNAMIHPLIRYRIRGALWYQGESNASDGLAGANDYTDLQIRLIASWRLDWGLGNFPFFFVQLPNYNNEDDRSRVSWAFFRESQANILKVPGTGMAVTIDIGEADNIHPKNKQEAGRRLALLALADVYHLSIVSRGPQFSKAELTDMGMKIYFQHTDCGLVTHNGPMSGFAIAGADKQWHRADARIVGQAVIVSSAQVPQPVAVRYDWANNPDGNLYNTAGLPAMPFRTDRWP